MVSYAPFAGERAFETSADLFRIIDAIKWSGPPHGFAKKLPMLTSETSRDDNSSHLERWELLHDAKPVDSLGHDQDGQDSCGVCEFFGLMVRLQSEIGSLVLLLQKIPEGFNLVEEKGSGLAMHVQNDACFHAGQVTNEYLTVMTRRFEPPTSLEQILARACWIACNQRRLHYDLLTPVQ